MAEDTTQQGGQDPQDTQAQQATTPPATQPAQATATQSQPPVTTPQPADDKSQDDKTVVLDRAYVEALRRENAEARVFKKQQEDAIKAKADADLSEQAKLAKRIAELEAAQSQREIEIQQTITDHAIQRVAAELNAVDTEAVARLIDLSQVEYDGKGQPINAKHLVKDLLKNKPYLVKQASTSNAAEATVAQPAQSQTAAPQAQAAAQPKIAPTNGARQAPGQRYSAAQIADMGFYRANKADIDLANREGRIDP